jgi:hypothetical protein
MTFGFVNVNLFSQYYTDPFYLFLTDNQNSGFNPLSIGVLNISELRDLPQPLSVEYLSLSPHQEEEDRHINTSRDPEVIKDTFFLFFTVLDTWFH